MAFALSPSVNITETDLSGIIPGVSASTGAYAGIFQWGPIDEPRLIDNEQTLVSTFNKPDANTAISFFTAANFLAYTNSMLVVRSVNHGTAKNSVANVDANVTVFVKNEDHYLSTYVNGEAAVGEFCAKYPGKLGNSIRVSMADSATFVGWDFESLFDNVPGTSDYVANLQGDNDELHVIVIDDLGLWTGTPGTILEKFQFLSKASDARQADGTSQYYKTVINNRSKYVWWMDHPENMTNWGSSAFNTSYTSLIASVDVVLRGGNDGNDVTDGNLNNTWELFANDEKYDISLIPVGAASLVTQLFVINNIAEKRKDCIVCLSPELSDVFDNVGTEAQDVVDYRGSLPSTSYAVLDSGWKYQYDRYRDVYLYVPLNGDVAGCMARTDYTNDPWWSPAGLNRGQIKNVLRLAFSPNKTERDLIYPKGINPVVSFPGNGTVLYGDRTLLAKPSAFDRINVRRLFIVLEKAIASAAKFQLFEFNDGFTRSAFVNMVSPFLRDVQGRRGIRKFEVICDETNNTPEVIDRNEFVATIMVTPNKSINSITLNFVATRSGVNFEELPTNG